MFGNRTLQPIITYSNFKQSWTHLPGRQLHVQKEQQKHQNKVWNMFKVNNKDTIIDI